MKKMLSILICLFVMLPIIQVKADGIICNNGEKIDLDKVNNFLCNPTDSNAAISTNIEFSSGKYDEYFTVAKENNGVRITITNKLMTFSTDEQYGKVIITDKDNPSLNTLLYIKNKNYVKPTTTTTTTTTTENVINTKTFTVTLDPNNGTTTSTKTCQLTGNSTTCSVTLPKLETENFNGWGTAKTCKIGNSGSIKVEKDITYYACYKDSETSTTTTQSSITNLYLKTLKLTDKDTNDTLDIGTFSMKKTEYSLKVLNTVKNISVITTQDDGINVEIIGNENLQVGETEIIIKLTDENNNTNQYKIKVTRLKEGETISNIHFLKSLVVGGYNINFNKEQFVYSLTIPNDITRLEITPIPEEETSMIEIKNNEELIDGSLITINVIGEDNETTTYTIDITKEAGTNSMLLIAAGVIILLIIILVILIMIKSNKKKQNIKNNNKPKVLDSKKKEPNETIETLNI